jgi:hypothetical protein
MKIPQFNVTEWDLARAQIIADSIIDHFLTSFPNARCAVLYRIATDGIEFHLLPTATPKQKITLTHTIAGYNLAIRHAKEAH